MRHIDRLLELRLSNVIYFRYVPLYFSLLKYAYMLKISLEVCSFKGNVRVVCYVKSFSFIHVNKVVIELL